METKHQENLEEFSIRLKTDFNTLNKKYANLKNDMVNSHRIEMNIAHGKQTSGVGQPHSPEKSKMSTSRSKKPN